MLTWLLVAFFAPIVTLRYWAIPQRLYRQRVKPATVRAISFDELPPEVAPLMAAVRDSLRTLDFEAVSLLGVRSSEREGYAQLFSDGADTTTGIQLVLRQKDGHWGNRCAFSTERSDGTRITTSTFERQSFLAPDPRDDTLGVTCTDATALERLHRVRAGDVPVRKSIVRSDPLTYQRATEQRVHGWWIESGEWVREGDVLRPTLFGAVLMGWRLVFPWRQLREAKRKRRQAALERAAVERPN